MMLRINDDRDCSRATLGLLKRGNNMKETSICTFRTKAGGQQIICSEIVLYLIVFPGMNINNRVLDFYKEIPIRCVFVISS